MMVDPFGWVFDTYLRVGWQPIPLPPAGKKPAPKGTTGREGKPMDLPTLRKHAGHGFNIGLRAPRNVVGVDVDQYGGKAGWDHLEQWRQERGLPPLPPTPRSTARGAGNPSGIRWFRVPSGFEAVGIITEHVEVVQHRHRYGVAPPSIHPDTGTAYQWIDADGVPAPVIGGTMLVPGVIHLATLPDVWCDAIREKTPTVRSQVPTVTPSVGGSAYALTQACDLLATAGEGNRNNLLNWCAYTPGREAVTAGVPRELVEENLLDAATRCGLDPVEAALTIRSGLDS